MSLQTRAAHDLEHQRLGVPSIVFMVLAAVAPMGAVVGVVPLAIALGNGAGAPGAWLLAGAVLLFFAVGYAAMSRHVTNAGGFYTYVARGLGKPAGVCAAFVAVIAYNAVTISVVGVFALFARDVAASVLGIHMAWQAWCAIGIMAVALLAWREVEVSAKVLGVALVLEVLILLVMDVAILAQQGFSAFTLDVFNPSVVFAGAPGIGLLLAFYTFIGFEQTAVYSEEAKDPHRTVPRATYVAVGIITGFYIITSWALIAGYGADKVHKVAAADPAGFTFTANAQYVGGFTNDAMQLLVISSLFAAMLSLHNATARYFFALGRERILPSALSRTHPRHHSPYVGSAVQLTITILTVLPFAIANSDPYLTLGASMAGLGTLGVILLQAGAAFSVIGFFRRRRDPRLWPTLIAPLIGAAGLVTATVLVLENYSALTGKTSGITNQLPWILAAAAAVGLAYGVWLRGARPDIYAGIGREAVLDDVVTEASSVGAASLQTTELQPTTATTR
jgi:amino acid transporter